MYDIVTIGSALVDIFIKSRQFVLKPMGKGTLICQVYGEKIDVDGFTIVTGGGGSNTAVGFSRAGFNVACVTELGKDSFSEQIISEFHDECVATNFIIREKREETGGSVIMIGEDGGRTIMVHRGASSMLDPHDIPMKIIKKSDWVHLSSIAGRLPALQMIATALKEGNTYCSWNPGSAELDLINKKKLHAQTLPCKILMLNAEEWRKIRVQQASFKEVIPEIIVTDGDKGGKLYLQNVRRPITFNSSGLKVVDATGAGDSFAVGYVSARLKGLEPLKALEWGNANAGSVISHMGAKAGLLTVDSLSKV